MATKSDKDQPGKWKGDEVEDAPSGEAERAADRAEGNAPITVADAARRRRDDEAVGPLREAAPNALSPEEKIAEAADEHQKREDSGGRGRGKI